MRTLPHWGAAVLLGALVAPAPAQIKKFSLEEMVQTADQAIEGQIVRTRVFRTDSVDAGPVYYTALTIQGTGLFDGRPLTVDVTFRGGFVSPTEGVFNSEAPAADDVREGRRVLAFYQWADNLAGGLSANMLVAAHGGLYRVVEGPRGATVLGRGEGYAVRANVRSVQLASGLKLLASTKAK